MERPCRLCLFNSIEREQIERNIREYIESLSPEEKAGERLYNDRLKLCFECPNCIDGLCRICGCFVRARAAKTRSYCPDTPKKW